MTFATAGNFVNDMLKQSGDDGKLQKHLADVARPSMMGLGNLATMFGFGTNKAAFNAAFGTGNDSDGNRHENVLWGTNGVVRRTLAYWRDGIVSMFNHIGRLRKQIMVKDQESKAVAEENKVLRAALDASETKRKAAEAAMEKKEREFNERASIQALRCW